MKKLLLMSAAVVALSGGLFADTIWVGSQGSLTAIPTTASFTGSQVVYTGSTVNATNAQVPFWNNPSQDNAGLADSACVFTGCAPGHVANVGDVLAGLATGTDLIGSNLTGTPSGSNNNTVIGGSYFNGLTGNGDPVSAATPTTVSGKGTNTVTPALEFSFMSQATALQVSVLFADSGLDCPTTGAGCNTGQYTSFGTYILGTGSCGSNCQFLPTAIGTASMNISGTPGSATVDPNDNATTVYGYYATVCYSFSGGVCSQSITYTTGAGNFTNSTLPALTGALGWNHFSYFELTNGEMVFGLEDGLSVGVEGAGDYNDLIFAVTGNPPFTSSTPEPGTIAIMGLGLAGLGIIGRRRFAKK